MSQEQEYIERIQGAWHLRGADVASVSLVKKDGVQGEEREVLLLELQTTTLRTGRDRTTTVTMDLDDALRLIDLLQQSVARTMAFRMRH